MIMISISRICQNVFLPQNEIQVLELCTQVLLYIFLTKYLLSFFYSKLGILYEPDRGNY